MAEVIKVYSYVRSRQVPYTEDNNILEVQYIDINTAGTFKQSFKLDANYANNSGFEIRFLGPLGSETTGRIFTLVNDSEGTPAEIAWADLKYEDGKVKVDVVFGDKSISNIEISAENLKKKIYFRLNYKGCVIADTAYDFDDTPVLPTLTGKPQWLLFRNIDKTKFLKKVRVGLARIKVDVGYHLLVPAQYRAIKTDPYRMCYFDQATSKPLYSETADTDPAKVKEVLTSTLKEQGLNSPQRIAVKER